MTIYEPRAEDWFGIPGKPDDSGPGGGPGGLQPAGDDDSEDEPDNEESRRDS